MMRETTKPVFGSRPTIGDGSPISLRRARRRSCERRAAPSGMGLQGASFFRTISENNLGGFKAKTHLGKNTVYTLY